MSTWVAVKQWAPTVRRGSWRNVTYRQVLDADAISTVGSKIRLTLRAAAGYDLALGEVFVGKSASVDSPEFVETPTRVTFYGGVHNVTMNDGSSATSDDIDFDYDPSDGDALVVSFYVPVFSLPYDNARLNTAGLAAADDVKLYWCPSKHTDDMPGGMGGDDFTEDLQFKVLSVTKIELYDETSFAKFFEFDFGIGDGIPAEGRSKHWALIGGMYVASAGANATYAELYLFAPGGASLLLGGVPNTSSFFTGFEAEKAFDGNLATRWAANGVIGEWLGYDFYELTDVGSIETIWPDTFFTQAWRYYLIGYSFNGLDWTGHTFVNDDVTHTSNGVRTHAVTDDLAAEPNLDPTDPHRYWRVLTTQQGNGNVYQQIGRIQLLASDMSTNLVDTVGGTPSADYSQPGFGAANAFTASTATRWADDAQCVPRWLQWDFGSAQTVRGYKMRAHAASQTSMPIGWKFQCSDDGTNWKTVEWVVNQGTWSSGEERTFPKVEHTFKFDYRVRQLSPIGKFFAFDYEIRGTISKDFEFDYVIGEFELGVSFVFDYGIGSVEQNFTFDYELFGLTIKDFEFDYSVAYTPPISEDFEFDYAITGNVERDFPFDYEIYFVPPKPIFEDFRFDYGVDLASQPITLIPDTPVIETWIYDTAKAVSYNGTEQRAALRNTPKVVYEYSYVLDNEERKELYNQIFENITNQFYVPMFASATTLTQAMSAGNTMVYCDLERTDIRPGLPIFYVTSDDRFSGTGVVDTVEADYFTVVDGVSIDLPSGSWVMPARMMYIADDSGIAMRSMSGEASLVFNSVGRRAVRRPTAVDDLVPTYDGLMLLDKRPLADNDVTETFEAEVTRVERASDVPVTSFPTWMMPGVAGEREFYMCRPEDFDFWREFAHKAMGQRTSFLAPTFRPDLVPASGNVPGAVVDVIGTKFAGWANFETYQRLRFETAAGVFNRKVSSAVKVGGNTRITLDDALPTADIFRISFLNRVRLASDQIRFQHEDVHSLVTITLRTVNE